MGWYTGKIIFILWISVIFEIFAKYIPVQDIAVVCCSYNSEKRECPCGLELKLLSALGDV